MEINQPKIMKLPYLIQHLFNTLSASREKSRKAKYERNEWQRVEGGYKRRTEKPKPGSRPMPAPRSISAYPVGMRADSRDEIIVLDTLTNQPKKVTIEQLRSALVVNAPLTLRPYPGQNPRIETLPRRGYLDHDCDPGHCTDNTLAGPPSPRLKSIFKQ